MCDPTSASVNPNDFSVFRPLHPSRSCNGQGQMGEPPSCLTLTQGAEAFTCSQSISVSFRYYLSDSDRTLVDEGPQDQ